MFMNISHTIAANCGKHHYNIVYIVVGFRRRKPPKTNKTQNRRKCLVSTVQHLSISWRRYWTSPTHKNHNSNCLHPNTVRWTHAVAKPCFKQPTSIWYINCRNPKNTERPVLSQFSVSLSTNESHGTGIKLYISVHVYKPYDSHKLRVTLLITIA